MQALTQTHSPDTSLREWRRDTEVLSYDPVNLHTQKRSTQLHTH